MFSEVKNVNVESLKNGSNLLVFWRNFSTKSQKVKETKSQREEETKSQREEGRKDRFFEPLMFMNLIQ